MTATFTIAVSTALTLLQLRHALRIGVRDRTRLRLRDRLETLVPFAVALGVVALATVGYLELVATLLAALE